APPPPPPPKAWIVVDADTGAVVDASNERVPLRAASVIKLLTALIAVEQLPPEASVPVSAVTEGMPATKINMKAGQTWELRDTLYSLLIVSANDAAVALAERVSGSRAGFAATMAAAGRRPGLQGAPVLHDPAGLDAEPFALGAVDAPRSSAELLDKGFLLPVALEGHLGYLPPVASVADPAPTSQPRPREVQVAAAREVAVPGRPNRRSTAAGNVVVLVIGSAPALAILGRRRRLRRGREGKRPFFSWGLSG